MALLRLLALAIIGMTSSAHAQLYLELGQSANISGTRVYCGGRGALEEATSKTCAQHYSGGGCVYFNEQTITGRRCAQGEVCGREYSGGGCVYFNTTAECGEESCTTSKVCGRHYSGGGCVYFNTIVTCR